MDHCLPVVLILVTQSGCCRPFMLDRDALVRLGCPAEGPGAGGQCPLRGFPRVVRPALSRCDPLAGCGWGGILLPHGIQLAYPRVDGVNALPDLLTAALAAPWFIVHVSSCPLRLTEATVQDRNTAALAG